MWKIMNCVWRTKYFILFLAKHCAEGYAISSAYRFRADLTKCTLYTTKYPCIECTKVIVQAGIKVVVCGEKKDQEDDIVYRSKSCFT